MESIDLNSLAQAMDTTWGRSSTPRTASYSVKFSFAGENRITASYQVVVNFASEREMILTKRRCSEESMDVIDANVKSIKDVYKELTGETVKFKDVSSTDSVEIIGFNVHNPKRTALYRRKTVFEVA